eukprot:TRINITY_DN78597_c0_g1_i1.p1 TRINITY_DN78597_c0_g1~~TRINITY_DN78597_c0_g1_i1.p1  ORF type:complete len:366 (+),score=113.21 TRINITY_DN78597_c0_g1_i1:37-1098(+)
MAEKDASEKFTVGSLVQVAGLVKAPELNGRKGLITKPLNSDGRHGVWLLPTDSSAASAAAKGAEKAMKAANLVSAETEAEKTKRISPFLKMYKELVEQITGRASSLDVPVEVNGRRSTAEDAPRLTPISGSAAKGAWRQGAEALSQLQLCGVQLDKAVKEESGKPDFYSDWLLCQATTGGDTLTVVDGFALKVLDTVGVFDEHGDTLCDVDPLLKTVPGFAKLSEVLDTQFMLEDSLTSGYNNFVTFGADQDAKQMGAAVGIGRPGDRFSRHWGPGTLKSKAAKRAAEAGSPSAAKGGYAGDYSSEIMGADGKPDPEKLKELMQMMGSNLQCGDGAGSEEFMEFMQKATQGKC